ncbi:MAG TPA: aminotransferase class III-fold pyridoxal phosphate-dependent enzyme, partial [Candidatus Limnocylindria bacterium]|nr:aminotransferase class III-fold pyridoxal phosphate-dependent enzyme [Candidatus Limnocylindria bacterium]
SQLMCVNIGHADDRVVKAIQEQAAVLAYANPFMATEPRARLAAKLAEITPGDIEVFFFTNGGAEANENAIKIARFVTGRHKIMARYRSYHGGTAGAITLTGDPRRWAAEPGIPGVVRVRDPYHGIQAGWDTADEALAELEEVIQLEGPNTIAGFILETVTGTNGILVPPDGYLQGVREICDRYGIMMIADEVMAGFGRTGKWFAVDHWNVVPDLITMAKGLTSAYVQLGAVGMRRKYAEHFNERVFYGGLTYNSHPLACATALATIAVYEEEGLLQRAVEMGGIMRATWTSSRRDTRRSGRCAASVCSGSWSWCATGRPWSRWRPSTAPRMRWPRWAAASERTVSTPWCAGTTSSRTRRWSSARRRWRRASASSIGHWR